MEQYIKARIHPDARKNYKTLAGLFFVKKEQRRENRVDLFNKNGELKALGFIKAHLVFK